MGVQRGGGSPKLLAMLEASKLGLCVFVCLFVQACGYSCVSVYLVQ